MRWWGLTIVVFAGACSSFASKDDPSPTADAGVVPDAATPDGAVVPDAASADGWCATNHPGAIFCDDFDNGRDPSWKSFGVAVTDLAGKLRLTATLVDGAPTFVGVTKSFPKHNHVTYSFDLEVVSFQPADTSKFFRVPVSEIRFASGPHSNVEIERASTDGTLSLIALGFNQQPKTVTSPTPFQTTKQTIRVDSKAVGGGNDVLSVSLEGSSPTSTTTTFVANDDLAILLGTDTTMGGTVAYTFDNFVVETLE